jgi:hypothetical protein
MAIKRANMTMNAQEDLLQYIIGVRGTIDSARDKGAQAATEL